MTSVRDSSIFGSLFIDEEIAELIDDNAQVRALVEVEIALARAEARVGVIPSSAAEQIAKATDPKKIDMGALAIGTARSGFPIIALVQELRKLVGVQAASYLHWGATMQDIMDTACVLQLRSVIKVFENRLVELARYLGELAHLHRRMVVAGRTHGQQVLLISFGLKVAAWLAPFVRHGEDRKSVV